MNVQNLMSNYNISINYSGGVDIPVEGRNLDSIANPQIIVTVICRSNDQVIAAVSGVSNNYYNLQ